MRDRSLFEAAIVVLSVACLLHSGTSGAATPAEKCAAGKIAAAGKFGSCLLLAESKARKKGTLADTEKCEQKLATVWEKLENKGGCPAAGGGLEENRSDIEQHVLSISSALAGASTVIEPDVKCESSKLAAAATYEKCRAVRNAKALKRGTSANHDACDTKLRRKWEKTEARAAGACPTNGDEEAIREEITTHVDLGLGSLAPPTCGNGALDAGEQCDGSAPGSQCPADLCTNDCTCSICCASTLSAACSQSPTAGNCEAAGGTLHPGEYCSGSGQCTVDPQPGPYACPLGDGGCYGGLGSSPAQDCAGLLSSPDQLPEPHTGWFTNAYCTADGVSGDWYPLCAPRCLFPGSPFSNCYECGVFRPCCNSNDVCDPVDGVCIGISSPGP